MSPTPPSAVPKRSIQVDEEGYFHFNGVRIVEESFGRHLFENLMLDDKGRFVTEAQGAWALVEAFDQPLVAQQVSKKESGTWEILLPFDYRIEFSLDTLALDEWDRFHGYDVKGRPFVFSRKAQATFFDLLDEFDDTSITVDGKKYEIGPWLEPRPELNEESFWTSIYQTEDKPGWELDEPAAPLRDVLPQLKIPRSRILVLGSGSGNDAAFFAEQGHVVTAVDVSPEAIAQGKKKYGHVDNLRFVEADIFNLPEDFNDSFDVVFEHTCFCAITPERRNELVKVWRRCLVEGGHLLGIFFVFFKRTGPPYGGTEWEIRERLKNNFQFLFWTRWKKSLERRAGLELVVYALKK